MSKHLEKIADGTWEFEDLLNEYLLYNQKKNMDRWAYIRANANQDLMYVSPSQVFRCFLNQTFSDKMPREKTLKELKILFFGNLIQDHVIAEVLEWKYGHPMHSAEKKVGISIIPSELYIQGYIDDLMIFKHSTKDEYFFVPMEGKSQAGGLKYRKNAKLEHIQQLTTYLVSVGAQYGYLIYVDRSGMSNEDDEGTDIGISKTFLIKFDPKVWAEIEERCKTRQYFVKGDLVPPPEARLNAEKKKECNWCAYKKECDFYMANLDQFRKNTKGTWTELVKMFPHVFKQEGKEEKKDE